MKNETESRVIPATETAAYSIILDGLELNPKISYDSYWTKLVRILNGRGESNKKRFSFITNKVEIVDRRRPSFDAEGNTIEYPTLYYDLPLEINAIWLSGFTNISQTDTYTTPQTQVFCLNIINKEDKFNNLGTIRLRFSGRSGHLIDVTAKLYKPIEEVQELIK